MFFLFSSLSKLSSLSISFTSLHVTYGSTTLKSLSLTSTLFHVPEHTSSCPLFIQDSKVAPQDFLSLSLRLWVWWHSMPTIIGRFSIAEENRDLSLSTSRNWPANVMRSRANSSPEPPKNWVWPTPSLLPCEPTVESPVHPPRLLTERTGSW